MAKRLARPELLAPAGDEESLRAAVAAGADAVYFGLRGGFNARARADNFAIEDLPRVFDFLHRKGVQGFITFNTLVFDSELPFAEQTLSAIARAGADAILVQDLGALRLARAVCAQLPLHASTQMTVSSPEAARIAEELGVTRIVLPRELSIEEIRLFAQGTDLELECFVHGALCVSWSGQCLTSEALQHRSANRGQCAQSCRMPYRLVLDGREELARGNQQLDYLLSPRDLAAYDLLPELIDAGVSCFKIEGRMKGPEYVANVVDKYRRALDAAIERRASPLSARDEEELRYSFSRGFSHGFLRGSNHQELVHGLYPGHRGVLVGRVVEVHARARHVLVATEPSAPELKPGDRILFDQGKPEDDEPRGGLFACERVGPALLRLSFGGPDESTLDLRLVRPGDVVWKAKDAELTRKAKRIASQERRVGLELRVRGAAGSPLVAEAKDDLGRSARVESAMPLARAVASPLHEGIVREKLCALGESEFALRRLVLELEGSVALPPQELKRMRRALISALSSLLGVAVEKVRAAGLRVVIATPRVQKPGEEGYDARFERLKPDGILARHLGALEHFRRRGATTAPGFTVHGDFSLNATNAVTARTLLGLGLATLTPAYDLDLAQLRDLCAGVPGERLEVTIHQHLPLFHNEHCVYAHLLSAGADFRTCGRPCESHLVHLRDHLGLEHPVIVDVGCRNTVFNARAQSAAGCFPTLLGLGVRRFRVELVRENAAETRQVLTAYAELLQGTRPGRSIIRDLGALEKYGVSAGTLAVVTRPEA
ncbi:MAG: U32 family peptidase [Deltaproteobacteria bacterium]|nr:MAG: U32 family peptidase [Deltaproteobacteria bacterium]